jgi:hypothetical protein
MRHGQTLQIHKLNVGHARARVEWRTLTCAPYGGRIMRRWRVAELTVVKSRDPSASGCGSDALLPTLEHDGERSRLEHEN